jgi:hypothetical protein bfra3_16308|nr:MAG TPA: hypothetical protein [Caudoviricetes sp.]
MGTIKERLEKIAAFDSLSIRRFEEKCGLKRGNISNMSNESSIGSDKLSKIIDTYSSIDIEWLLTGKGDMLKNETTRPVQNTSCAVISDGKDARKISKTQLKKADNSTKGIPLIPLHAMAGVLRGEISVLEYECEQYVVPAFKGADFLIPVKGNSMFPTYQSGDIVACQRTPMSSVFFQWNKPYVLDTAQGAIIKRIRPGVDDEHVQIVSDNTDYLPFYLHKSEIYAVALVIGIIRLE